MGWVSSVTVTAPATSYALISLADARDELQIKDGKADTWLNRAINQVSSTIGNYCNRVFQTETIQEFISPRPDPFSCIASRSANALLVNRYPIVSIASLTQLTANGVVTLTEGTDFRAIYKTGQLIRLNTTTGFDVRWEDLPITITYVGGFSTIPDDIQDAALRLLTARWFARGRDPMKRSDNQPGLGGVTYWVGGPPMSGSIPEEISGILDNYRVPVVA